MFAKLKSLIKPHMWRGSDALLQVIAPRAFRNGALRRRQTSRHISVLITSGAGSVGDAAMTHAAVQGLRGLHPDARITLISHEPGDAETYAYLKTDHLCLKGYFERLPSAKACRALGALFGSCTDFVVLGADILDGRYSESRSFRRLYLAEMAHRLGVRAHIIGFSFAEAANPRIVEWLSEHGRQFNIFCREPLSAARVSKIIGRPVESGADIAFLLPLPSYCDVAAAQRAERRLEDWHDQGRPVVVLNANPLGLLAERPDIDLASAARSYAAAMSALSRKTHAAILLLTHDNRPAHSDAAFMEKIAEHLPTDIPQHFVEETVRPTDIKRLCHLADLVITGRMHLGIASLGAGTPAMILDYQGKVRGLLGLFTLNELAFTVEDLLDADGFATRAAVHMESRESLADRIELHLPKVKALSRKTVEVVGG